MIFKSELARAVLVDECMYDSAGRLDSALSLYSAPVILLRGISIQSVCAHLCSFPVHGSFIVALLILGYCLLSCRTFGKGLIQSVYELSDGSGMVITNGKYLTPALTDIDTEGIAPDFKLPPSPEVAANKLNACVVPNRPFV